MDGILPVYKPVGITSFDVIRAFKRAVHPMFKLGHAGTLDPFADGIMLLMLGTGTKQFDALQKLPKTYLATAVLGASSDTLDITGEISRQEVGIRKTTIKEVRKTAKRFVGEIEQKIPDYSAAKVGGQPRYKLARRGEALPSASKKVSIYAIDVLHYQDSNHGSEVGMRVVCGSGTYIRQLSYDIFASLGVESYLSALTRESVGGYTLAQCCQMADFSGSKWQDRVQRTGDM